MYANRSRTPIKPPVKSRSGRPGTPAYRLHKPSGQWRAQNKMGMAGLINGNENAAGTCDDVRPLHQGGGLVESPCVG